jgi:hypothetical protein
MGDDSFWAVAGSFEAGFSEQCLHGETPLPVRLLGRAQAPPCPA